MEIDIKISIASRNQLRDPMEIGLQKIAVKGTLEGSFNTETNNTIPLLFDVSEGIAKLVNVWNIRTLDNCRVGQFGFKESFTPAIVSQVVSIIWFCGSVKSWTLPTIPSIETAGTWQRKK